jgi:hypothetical protein
MAMASVWKDAAGRVADFGACAANGGFPAARERVPWPPGAFLFLLAFANPPLLYLAPRPVSTTRRVSATIWASIARV